MSDQHRGSRPPEDQQNAAVATFIDVTGLSAVARLRGSEERYRLLIESLDGAFSIVELVRDQDASVVDEVVREANAAFGRQTGLGPDVVGRRLRDLNPGPSDGWLQLLERVIQTGETERFEAHQPDTDRW